MAVSTRLRGGSGSRMVDYIAANPARSLLIVFILFYVYMTTIPWDFHFNRDAFIAGLDASHLRPFTMNEPMMDMIVNFTLFFVFGIIMYIAMVTRGRSKGLSLVAPILWGVVMSFCMEVVQIFSPIRIATLTDVFMAGLGSATGAFAGFCFWGAFRRWVFETAAPLLPERPWTLILSVYSVLIFLCCLAPMDLTSDIGEIRRNVRDINLAPFARPSMAEDLAMTGTEAIPPGESPEEATAGLTTQALNRDLIKMEPMAATNFAAYWGGLLKEFGLFAVLGFAAFCAFREWPPAKLRMAGYLISAVVVGLIMGVMVQFFRLFVVSARTDVTNVIISLIGSGLGAAVAFSCSMRFYRKNSQAPQAGTQIGAVEALGLNRKTVWWLVNLVILFNFAVILYDNLMPFRPTGTLADGFSRMTVANWIPFYHYFIGRGGVTNLPIVVKDMFNVVMIYTSFGFLLYYNRIAFSGNELGDQLPVRAKFDRKSGHIIGFIALVVGLTTEFPQLIMPPRIPEIGDVMLGCMGAWLGCVACHSVFLFRDTYMTASRTGPAGITHWRERMHQRAMGEAVAVA